jgi:hypothetical protein
MNEIAEGAAVKEITTKVCYAAKATQDGLSKCEKNPKLLFILVLSPNLDRQSRPFV